MKPVATHVGWSLRRWSLLSGFGLMLAGLALFGGSHGLARTGPALGLAPAVAQQSSASQIDASSLMKRIQSIAQPPRLRIIKERLARLAPALAPSAPALMPFAPVSITLDATPISGSAVVQGQVIAYAIQATNAASSDTTTGAGGGFVRIVDTAPPGTLFNNVTVQQQPQFGSAWSCTILGGGTSIECHAGDGAGSGVDTFTTQEFVKIRAEVTVQAATANGATLTNTATYEFDRDGGGLEGTATSDSVFHVVNPTADLGITKVTSNPTPTAGGAAFSYTVTVTNNGPNPAKDVIVSDPLPAGIIFQNASVVMNPTSPAMTCTGPPVGTNGTVICNSANFPNGQSAVITIVAQIVPNVASGVRTNTATVTSGTPEPAANVFPNTASVQQNIVVDAPLSITKAGPATVCAGDTLTYHVTVLNGGSSTALNATISDPLPANTTFLSLSGTGGFTNGCSFNGGTPGSVTCAAVDIPTGLSTMDITVKLAPSAPSGALGNTAQITTAGTGTIAVGTSTTTATVNHCSDLEITKDDSPDTVSAGQDINYTIKVRNVGPSNIASGEFVVNDPTFPPTGSTLKTGTTINAPGLSCNGGVTFPCTATSALAVGATAVINYSVTVNPNFNGGQPGGFVVNTATVSIVGGSNATDPIVTNNSSTSNTPVSPNADLSITNTAETIAGGIFGASVTAGGSIAGTLPSPVTGTGEILYTLTYRNNGPGDATNVHVRDDIPGGTLLDPTFLPIGVVVTPAAGPGLTCQILPTLNNYQLDCTPNTGSGVLPAAANGTIQFRVRVPENIAEGTVIRNQATLNSEGVGAAPGTPDPIGGNNTSNETQNIVRTSAELAITKTGPASVVAGNNITYTLTVTNNGPSDAQNVLIKDTLPPNVSFVSLGASSDPRFACQPDNGNAGIVNCTAASLIAPALNPPPIIPPRNGSNVAIITIVGKANANLANGAVLTNNASVSASTQDPVPANNAAAPVNTTVTTDAAVTIVKTDSPDPVIAGTNLTYTITVNNNGPSDAQSVNVVDTLPPATQVQFLSAVGTGVFSAANSCTQAANVVTCNAIPGGVLAAGASANITIVVRVLPTVPANVPPNVPDNASGLLNSATINWVDSNGVVGPLLAQAATDIERTTVRNDSSTLSIDNVTVTEGTGGTTNATFTVTMAAQSSLPVTVDYVTSDITASAASDYTSQAGTLTFAPGVTTRSIIVPVIGDGAAEPTETFLVTLFNPTNATIGTALGTGTINDDDATGVFQFSAATANVNENAIPGSINLTINRTGDTSGVSSVGFETSDITAAQKTDYTFNSGTVQFAPGDTSKTINVLIVNDALVEAPETFRVSLQNPSGNFVVGSIAQSVVTITSDDAAPGPNPLDTAGFFVRQQYLDFLGREPDPAGLTFWTNNITSCGADPACTSAKRIDTSAAFFLSVEFQETSGNVIRTQRVAFSRLSAEAASRVPYLQFMRDTRQVGQGVIIGQAGADALLEQNKQAYALAIVNSPAFIARFPVSPAAVYVDSLTVSAAVVLTAAERSAAISAFGLGGTAGRVAALRSIADSSSVRGAEFSASFVLAEYYGYLRRNPTDVPDFNDAGYQFWLTKLNTFGGDFRQADMVKSFILSTEYRQRFGTP